MVVGRNPMEYRPIGGGFHRNPGGQPYYDNAVPPVVGATKLTGAGAGAGTMLPRYDKWQSALSSAFGGGGVRRMGYAAMGFQPQSQVVGNSYNAGNIGF